MKCEHKIFFTCDKEQLHNRSRRQRGIRHFARTFGKGVLSCFLDFQSHKMVRSFISLIHFALLIQSPALYISHHIFPFAICRFSGEAFNYKTREQTRQKQSESEREKERMNRKNGTNKLVRIDIEPIFYGSQHMNNKYILCGLAFQLWFFFVV